MHAKRAVPGRSAPFDLLLRAFLVAGNGLDLTAERRTTLSTGNGCLARLGLVLNNHCYRGRLHVFLGAFEMANATHSQR